MSSVSPEQVKKLATLYEDAFPHSRPWRVSEIVDLSRKPGFCISHTVGDTITGFAIGRTVLDEAELITLAVAPNQQGQGHGRDLLAKFESMAYNQGATRLFLEVAADNQAAIQLYERAHWQRIGARKAYYARTHGAAVDALLYEKFTN